MARHYEETALIEFVKKYTPTINGETTMECVERAIREAPTADVVPKSEYDRLEKLFNDMTQEAKGYLNRLYGIRAEVAREIFEDIWASIATHAFTANSEDYEDGAYDTIEWVDSKIAEVEKKYTEGTE